MPAFSPTARQRIRPTAWVTGAVWCAATLSLGYWVWLFPSASAIPAAMVATSPAPDQVGSAQWSRVLGAVPLEAAPSAADRLQLVGVISGPSGQGSALIAIDGQAPKPYQVGQAVGDGLVLQGLEPRKAHLGALVNGPKQRTLQLPALQTP